MANLCLSFDHRAMDGNLAAEFLGDVRSRIEGWQDDGSVVSSRQTLAEALAEDVLERLVRYARIDTQAERDRTGSPSTPGQLDLGRLLVAELGEIGLEDAGLDENGYVTATLQASGPLVRRREAGRRRGSTPPVIGLLAHVDVSPDAPAAGVEPIVHRGYDGGVIVLPRGGTVLDPQRMPELARQGGRGHRDLER